MLGKLFNRSLKDKNIEDNAEDGGLSCEVSEGNLKTLLGLNVILCSESNCAGQFYVKLKQARVI